MSTEIHTSTPGSKSRRKVVIAAVLASIALLSTGAVAYWSGDSWSEEAMSSSVFPGLPGGDWTSTTSDDGWGSADTSSAATSTTTATGTSRPGTAQPAATAVVEPASDPTSSVTTTAAPAPSSSRASTAPAPSSTAAPSPSSRPTRGNPKPKPTSTKKPTATPTPSPTSSDGGCFLLVIC